MENIEVLEQRSGRESDGLCPESSVFNLEIEDNNNYFANGVLVHNCHESLAPGFLKIIAAYPQAVLIGTTATPARGDGRGLGDVYDGMVMARPTSKLIEEGWIVPCRVFAPYRPNLKGVKTAGGDYVVKDLEARMDKPKLVGDIVETWKARAANRLTIVYGVTCAHARHLFEEFGRAGVKTVYLDGETPTDERDQMLRDFATDGAVRVICNIAVLKQGVDIPAASCCVIARPTKSFVFYRQIVGRVRRPFTYPDGAKKETALILDHAGAVHLHGMPDEDVAWALAPSTKIQDVMKQKLKAEGRLPIHCPKCHYEFTGSLTCPQCRHKIPAPVKEVATAKGTLVEIQREKHSGQFSAYLQKYWDKCLRVMAYKGRTAGAAAQMFYGRYHTWPWELKNLHHMPDRGQWKILVEELYPQLLK